jgi:hypothetical protein
MLVYTSPAISLSYGAGDMVPGGSTIIPVVFALYVIGMPLVSVPGLAHSRTVKDYGDQADTVALSLRLVVDIVARGLLSLTMYFWLLLPVYAAPV